MFRLDKIQTVRFASLGVLALALMAAYLMVLGPRLSAASDIRDDVESAKQINAQTEARIKELKASQDRVPGMVPFATRLAGFFPPDADQKALFRQIKDAGNAVGISDVSITSVQPGPPEFGLVDSQGGAQATTDGGAPAPAANQIASQTLTISAKASLEKSKAFLKQLETLDRSFLISSVAVKTGEGGQELTIKGLMFMLPEPVDPRTIGADVKTDIPEIPGGDNRGKAATAVTADEQNLIAGLVQVPK